MDSDVLDKLLDYLDRQQLSVELVDTVIGAQARPGDESFGVVPIAVRLAPPPTVAHSEPIRKQLSDLSFFQVVFFSLPFEGTIEVAKLGTYSVVSLNRWRASRRVRFWPIEQLLAQLPGEGNLERLAAAVKRGQQQRQTASFILASAAGGYKPLALTSEPITGSDHQLVFLSSQETHRIAERRPIPLADWEEFVGYHGLRKYLG